MAKRKLTKIVLSESESNYQVNLEYRNFNSDIDLWTPSRELPKKRDYLEGFLDGLINYSPDIDVCDYEFENFSEKDDFFKPLPEGYFNEIKTYLSVLSFTGAGDC